MALVRNKFTRSLAASAGAISLIGLLAACGDDGSANDTGTNELNGKVVFWDQLYGSNEAWKGVMDKATADFEKLHPDVDIEHVAQPSDVVQFAQLFQSAAQAQSGPDVVMMQPSWSQTLAFHQALEPLDEYLDDDFRATLSGWDSAQHDGVTYGIPFSLQGQVIVYNKELFTQAGLDPEDPPASMDELLDAAETLKAANILPFSGGNKEGYLGDWAFSTIWPGVSKPGDAEALNVGDMAFTDDVVKSGVAAWLELIDGGFYNEDMPSITLAPDGLQPFDTGKAAMTFTIYSAIAAHSDAIGVDNLGIIPLLDGAKEAEVIPAGAAGTWTVTKFSENKEAAVEYAKFLSSVEVAQGLYDEAGYFPNHVDADYSQATGEYPAVADLVDLLLNSGLPTEMVVHGTWDGTTLVTFGNEVQLVVLGEKSLDDALTEVERLAAERRSQLIQ
jgi:raffinose/stachyose/melibiose transport system substrate-binding protein